LPGKEALVARFIDVGLLPPQHPKFGIRWENIAQRLTKRNWKRKSVVRLDGSGSLLASPGHCCDAGGGIDSRLTRP
jgi:hypothetical protein